MVLTDEGRRRLALGDGSFKITKFSVGDDEIDYSLFNKNDSRGSSYYDINILQTPILEAFTDNAVSLKNKCISIARTNLLYLPILEINEVFATNVQKHSSGVFLVAVNKDTEDTISVVNGSLVPGIILGETLRGGSHLRIDQGLDTTEISPSVAIDSDLVETQYIVEIDNRLGKIADPITGQIARLSSIDGDNIATYFFSLGTDLNFVSENTDRTTKPTQTIAGPRGTVLNFSIASSLELNTSTFLFNQLGTQTTMDPASTSVWILDRYSKNNWGNNRVFFDGACTFYQGNIMNNRII